MKVSAMSLDIKLMIHDVTISSTLCHFTRYVSSDSFTMLSVMNSSLFFIDLLQVKKFVSLNGAVTSTIPGLTEVFIIRGASKFCDAFDLLFMLESVDPSVCAAIMLL